MRLVLVACFALLSNSIGWSAIAHVADPTCLSTASGTSVTGTLSVNPTAGNTLVVMSRVGGAVAPTITVTSSPAGTWANDVGPLDASPDGAGFGQLSHSSNVTGGSTSVTVTINVAAVSIRACVMEVSGLTNTSSFDQQASARFTGSAAPSSGVTGTRTVADEIVIGGYFNDNGSGEGTTLSAGSGFTIGSFLNCGTAACIGLDYKIVSATGTDACTFTTTGSAKGGTLCGTYKIASGGGATVPSRLTMLGVGN